MKPVHDIAFVDEVLEEYFKKNTLSNNYMLKEEYLKHIAAKNLYYDIERENVFIYLKKNGFYRLYYFVNEVEETYSFNHDASMVLEILYRGRINFPAEHQKYWEQSGFKSHLSRDCYFLKNKNLEKFQIEGKSPIRKAQSKEELQYVRKLIDENLDLYTGDNLGLDEITTHAQAGLIYISYTEGNKSGMLQAELKNSIFWLAHIVVEAQFRGKGLARDLVEYYLNEGIETQCNQFQLWVIQDNTAAVNLYKKYGFIYLNKSTYSMLKI